MKARNKEGKTFYEYLDFYFTEPVIVRIRRKKYLQRIMKRRWKHAVTPYGRPKR